MTTRLACALNCWASMDHDTHGWLVGVPFETQHDKPHERLRLSPRHKRELANLTGVMMASTVFFLTPLLVSAPEHVAPEPGASTVEVDSVGARGDVPQGASTDSGQVLSTGSAQTSQTTVVPATATSAVESSPAPRGTAATSAHGVRPAIARKSGREGLNLRRSAPSLRPAVVRAVNTTPASAQMKDRDRRRKGFSGGLLRVLVGSGRHRVQPFPTPATSD